MMNSKDVVTSNYSLLLGDCLERMKEIPDGSVDLILTDTLLTVSKYYDTILSILYKVGYDR